MDVSSKRHNVSESVVREILGIPVNAMTMSQVLDRVDTAIKKKEPLHIGVINAAKLVNMHRDQYLKEDVLASGLVLADGAAVVLAGKILGQSLIKPAGRFRMI